MLTQTGNNFTKAVKQVLPDIHTQADAFTRMSDAEEACGRFMNNDADFCKAMSLWSEICQAPEEQKQRARQDVEGSSENTKRLFAFMSKEGYLEPFQEELPFLLSGMHAFEDEWMVKDPLNVFEMVRHILKTTVTLYESIDQAHGYSFALTQKD